MAITTRSRVEGVKEIEKVLKAMGPRLAEYQLNKVQKGLLRYSKNEIAASLTFPEQVTAFRASTRLRITDPSPSLPAH